jgi:hypothetical protein
MLEELGGTITSLNGSHRLRHNHSPPHPVTVLISSSLLTQVSGSHTLLCCPICWLLSPTFCISTTQWSSFYNSPISFFNAGSNLLFSGTSTISLTPNPTFTTGTFSTLISGTSSLGNASATALTVSGATYLATTTASTLSVSGQSSFTNASNLCTHR